MLADNNGEQRSAIVTGHRPYLASSAGGSHHEPSGTLDGTFTAPKSITVGTGEDLFPFDYSPLAGSAIVWKSEVSRTDGMVADQAPASC
jgi:hypothetical protein